MKRFKKLTSLLLALAMVCAMSVTAFADDGYTITISNSTDGYTYVAYQIFAGDLSTDGKTLSNVTWGSDIASTNTVLLAALEKTYGTTDAAAIAAKITSTEAAAAFAEIVAPYVSGGTSSGMTSPYTITVTDPGYYLVINTVVPEGDYAYSDYIMEVVDNVTVNPKSTTTPVFDKIVGDENTETDTINDDATEDYAVGDDVPFTLSATLPDSYSAYTTYALTFHDTLSTGLSFNENSVVVKVGDTVVASGYTVVTDTTDDCSFEVRIVNTNALYDADGNQITVSANSVITVSYTAKLLSTATSIENNKASLEYSNNPNNSESTGTTTEDITYVVTFTVKVNKTNSKDEALSGAGFTLYKVVSVDEQSFGDGTYYTITGGVVTEATSYSEDTIYYVKVEEITTGTTFTFDGLAIGNYVLVETTTPDGYNTAEPIEFTIAAEAVEDANKTDGVEVTITSPTTTDDFTISAETLTTTVVNYAGSELPSTGGIGTTIFYVVGTIMVLGAVVVLITRKRMSAE